MTRLLVLPLLGPVVLNIVPYDDNIKLLSDLGVILTATSVSITVETLKELGNLNTRSGINILGAAVIDDIWGLILISVVLAVAQTSGSSTGNSGTLSIVYVFTKIILFCLFSIIGVIYIPKYMNKFTNYIKPGREFLTFSIAFAILIAYIAESLGIADITGAYICGLILSPLTHKEYLERNVKAISSGFLSLIFFASVGIEANLKEINLEVIFITLVMFIIAVVGKVVGCGGAARLLKMSKSESVQIGTGMISRGEVAIITVNIGLQKEIISEEIFLPTLIVVILTTIITPILIKLSFSHKIEKSIEA
ncbi:MAG: cation:proton antiporter [Clostridium sp.]